MNVGNALQGLGSGAVQPKKQAKIQLKAVKKVDLGVRPAIMKKGSK